MKKYIVELANASFKSDLAKFGKVGNPQVLDTLFILQTTHSKEEIEGCLGVIEVHEEDQAALDVVEEVNQEPADWALAWLSDTPNKYKHSRTGKGVDVYVLDTGIRTTHKEFEGRVRTVYSWDGQDYSTEGAISPTHGTSVAACVGGKRYGTAKQANIVNARSNFSFTDILKALDVIIKDHLDKPSNIPSILNFSGSSTSPMLGDLFKRAIDYGIVVVASAGNYTEPTPRYPAANRWIVSVGGIDSAGNPATFTNKNSDKYGPAVNVPTAHVNSDIASTLISGTSFSSPLDSGLLACALEGSDKFNTATQVSTFTHIIKMDYTDQHRTRQFDGGYPVRTSSTRVPSGVYYNNNSDEYTDEEIRNFCLYHIHEPEIIAQAAKDNNVDLARLVRATGYTASDINGYFAHHKIRPWWITDAEWNTLTTPSYYYTGPEDIVMESTKQTPVSSTRDIEMIMISIATFVVGFLLGYALL